MNPTLQQVTDRICTRSAKSRESYLQRIDRAAAAGPARHTMSCSNLAHGIAACSAADKASLVSGPTANIAIISSYNDMLSAHQPDTVGTNQLYAHGFIDIWRGQAHCL